MSVYTIGINYPGNTVGEWSNGSVNTITNNGTLTATGGDASATQLYIGTRGDSGTSFTGFFYEILVFNVALSTSDRQKMEGYLAWKWGLQKSLPSSHPFFNFPPG
jgi:hypothetical protein